tara:strand:- start:51 stop:323 length:273 start_codon:yes stop_codon:yes gene_type:complete
LSLTKKDLALNISKKLGLSQKDSLFFVQNFFKTLIEKRTSIININNFGTFMLKKTPKRVGRNPKTLQSFSIKARQKLVFKPSDKVKTSLN